MLKLVLVGLGVVFAILIILSIIVKFWWMLLLAIPAIWIAKKLHVTITK